MRIEIEIPDGSDELAELKAVVEQINKETGGLSVPITEQQYVNNIVVGYFANRVLNQYKTMVAIQPVSVLKAMFADIKKTKGAI